MGIYKGTTFLGGLYKNNECIGEVYKGDSHIASMGFPKTVSGTSPLTLSDARAKALTQNKLNGESKRTITIDGVEYVVPDEYTLLEYIESSGAQYINTGINPSGKKIGAVFDFQFTSTSSSTGGVFGSNKTDGTDNLQFTVYQSKWRTKINSFAHYDGVYNTSRHTVRLNMSDGTQLDDTVITETQYTISSTNTNNCYLGACNYGSGSTGDYTLVGKLYSAKVYDDTTLVRNFIPAKNSSNVLGMYDLVSGTFFTNAGTGSFTAGIELPQPSTPMGIKGVGNSGLPNGYKKLEYLQSSGEQYIDTGVHGTQNTKVEETLQLISIPSGVAGHTFGDFTTNTQSITMNLKQSGASRFGDASIDSVFGTLTTDKHTYGVDKNGYSVDGVITKSLTGITDFTTVGNLFWMSANYHTSVVNAEAKYYELKIWENNILVRNLIPACNRNTNVLGMYDTVTNTFFTNAGTGDFIAGPEDTSCVVPILQAQNCGMVDMGTLNWSPIGSGCFYTAITGKANGRNIYCSKYPTDQTSVASSTANMHIGGHDGNRVYFKNTSLENTRAAAQADLNGIMLYYQRTTDDTWTTPQTYTAYLDKPLHKVGTYADSFNFADGVHTEKVGVITLSAGTHTISDAMTDSPYICTQQAAGTLSGQSITLEAGVSDADVYYVKATSTISQHTAVPISTAKGTNYIEAKTEVKPSSMVAGYVSKTS